MPAPRHIPLTDARGRRITVLAGGNRERRPVSPERLQRIYDAQSRAYRLLNSIDVYLTIGVLHLILAWVSVLAGAFVIERAGGAARIAAVVAVVTVWGAAAYLLTRRIRTLDPKAYATAMLERGLCPGCAYTLAGLLPDAAGLTQCPECGGAWRLPVGETLPTATP